MGTYRLYTGNDCQSHIESKDLAEAPAWAQGVAATRTTFQEQPVGSFLDWHPAPRRQFFFILTGQLEIGLGDGTKHIFGPGDTRLVEDTTGQGHTTTVYGNQPCVPATVPLKGQ